MVLKERKLNERESRKKNAKEHEYLLLQEKLVGIEAPTKKKTQTTNFQTCERCGKQFKKQHKVCSPTNRLATTAQTMNDPEKLKSEMALNKSFASPSFASPSFSSPSPSVPSLSSNMTPMTHNNSNFYNYYYPSPYLSHTNAYHSFYYPNNK